MESSVSICHQNCIRTRRQFTAVVRSVVLESYCLSSKPSSTTMWPVDGPFHFSVWREGQGCLLHGAIGRVMWNATANAASYLEFSSVFNKCLLSFFFLRFYLFTFREKGREREQEGGKHQCVVATHAPPTGDLARNPGMCPDWDSNRLLSPPSHTSQGCYRCYYYN